MATQGIVTITVGGRVIVKAIAGCGGHHAQALADQIKEYNQHHYLDVPAIVALARVVGFGCDQCLVISEPNQDAVIHHFHGGRLEDHAITSVVERYTRTFDNPSENPRWQQGTAECVTTVEIERIPAEAQSEDADDSEDPRADYTEILDLCTTDELGKMLIASVELGDTDFADALREEIKHRRPESESRIP